jgi:hypothetical protein
MFFLRLAPFLLVSCQPLVNPSTPLSGQNPHRPHQTSAQRDQERVIDGERASSFHGVNLATAKTLCQGLYGPARKGLGMNHRNPMKRYGMKTPSTIAATPSHLTMNAMKADKQNRETTHQDETFN